MGTKDKGRSGGAKRFEKLKRVLRPPFISGGILLDKVILIEEEGSGNGGGGTENNFNRERK